LRKKRKNSTRFIKINPTDPEAEIISEAVGLIRQGGVVVFPTRNLYGLGTDASNVQATRRIFEIKRRPPDKPLLVLIKSREDVLALAEDIPASAACLMDHFWPGRITIVLRAKPSVHKALTGGTDRIGMRMPGHPVAAALAAALGGAIIGTSANISGKSGCSAILDLSPDVAEEVDLVLDAGPLTPGNGSTVVDAAFDTVRLLREGALAKGAIESVLKKSAFKMIDNSD
jgi:L-threonylcarbamoyladenylate synthase